MNQLSIEKRTQIITLLVEGNSLRSTSRISGCSINTVTKLLVDVGQACIEFHNRTVRNISARRVEVDEILSFVYAKQKTANREDFTYEDKAGDVWTWVGIDAESKLIISYLVGTRGAESANEFMHDIADRVNGRIQLTSDGHTAYLEAVDNAFGIDIDYARLVKLYGSSGEGGSATTGKYSPAVCTGAKKTRVSGHPNEKYVSTSYVERQNLTMRMAMRRFTRLTNAFSKKLENHIYAIAIHFIYMNFVRIHTTLRVPPAMQAGLVKELWEIEDIVRLADDKKKAEEIPAPTKPKSDVNQVAKSITKALDKY